MRIPTSALTATGLLALACMAALAQAQTTSNTDSGEPVQVTSDTASGEQVYQRWCSHCHDPGRGQPGTQSLQVKYGDSLPAVLLEREDLTPEAIKTFVRQGVLSMPPFRKTEITDAELDSLATYMTR